MTSYPRIKKEINKSVEKKGGKGSGFDRVDLQTGGKGPRMTNKKEQSKGDEKIGQNRKNPSLIGGMVTEIENSTRKKTSEYSAQREKKLRSELGGRRRDDQSTFLLQLKKRLRVEEVSLS